MLGPEPRLWDKILAGSVLATYIVFVLIILLAALAAPVLLLAEFNLLNIKVVSWKTALVFSIYTHFGAIISDLVIKNFFNALTEVRFKGSLVFRIFHELFQFILFFGFIHFLDDQMMGVSLPSRLSEVVVALLLYVIFALLSLITKLDERLKGKEG